MSQQAPRVAQDLLDEPHIEGCRVSVLEVRDRVEELGLDPETVADEFALDVADVYRALAYYHENSAEMQVVRARRERELDEVRQSVAEQRPDDVTPST